MSIENYLQQVNNNSYLPITSQLFIDIEEEGWIDELDDLNNGKKFIENDFTYTTLSLSSTDKQGLIDFNDDVVEKFNSFDIKLKENQKYPFTTIDFIDYTNGIVYIVKFK